MTKEEIEELIGLAAGMGLYDDKNPGKRAVILGKAIKELQQEPCEDAISRQEMLKYFEGWKNQIKYYHPYAKNFDIPYEEAIQRIKDVPPVNPQKPRSEWEHDHEILKAYSDGASAVLDKVRAEIDDLEEGISSYHNDQPWVFKDEVLQIIDKYKAEGGDKE